MAYGMRFRAVVKTVLVPGTPSADDPILAAVGDVTTDTVNPTSAPGVVPVTFNVANGPVFTSLARAASGIQAVNNRLQRSLGMNVRFEVWGKPVGTLEAGNPDLTADEKAEKLYIQGDTPTLGLLIAIARANHKVGTTHAFRDNFMVPVADPEVGILGAVEAAP